MYNDLYNSIRGLGSINLIRKYSVLSLLFILLFTNTSLVACKTLNNDDNDHNKTKELIRNKYDLLSINTKLETIKVDLESQKHYNENYNRRIWDEIEKISINSRYGSCLVYFIHIEGSKGIFSGETIEFASTQIIATEGELFYVKVTEINESGAWGWTRNGEDEPRTGTMNSWINGSNSVSWNDTDGMWYIQYNEGGILSYLSYVPLNPVNFNKLELRLEKRETGIEFLYIAFILAFIVLISSFKFKINRFWFFWGLTLCLEIFFLLVRIISGATPGPVEFRRLRLRTLNVFHGELLTVPGAPKNVFLPGFTAPPAINYLFLFIIPFESSRIAFSLLFIMFSGMSAGLIYCTAKKWSFSESQSKLAAYLYIINPVTHAVTVNQCSDETIALFFLILPYWFYKKYRPAGFLLAVFSFFIKFFLIFSLPILL
ncbi:MAG: hypothetical protein ACFFDT_29935, partial [Candidatus Hodarchaeota archaeon]